jgi:hypothetical protein
MGSKFRRLSEMKVSLQGDCEVPVKCPGLHRPSYFLIFEAPDGKELWAKVFLHTQRNRKL